MKKLYSFALVAALAMMGSSAMAQSYKYVKVTEAPAAWDGTYLIVYEADDENNIAYVFNGALEAKELDSKGNFFEASNPAGEDGVRVIEGNEQIDAAVFRIEQSLAEVEPTEYFVTSASGYSIGYDNAEKGEPNLEYSNETQFSNTISMEEGKTSVNICGKVSPYCLRFNADEGKERFRYHEAGKKKSIKLYRQVEDSATGIDYVKAEAGKQIHNLQGQPMESLQKGLNIVGGKVVLK